MNKSFVAAIGLAMALLTHSAAYAQDTYACGGAVEAKVWQLWDSKGRAFLRDELLGSRLIGQGNTYALYDIQSYLHNMQAMAQRCARTDRLIQLADELMKAYAVLEPLSADSADMAWICKGGAICNDRNRLINTEVMGVSVQGLGMMSALANALANSDDPKASNHPFVAKTAEVSAHHLWRWGDENAIRNWLHASKLKPEDIKDGSSAFFFTDKELWQISIYANLAGIYAVQPVLRPSFDTRPGERRQLRDAIRVLLQLFKARTSFETVQNSSLGRGMVTTADLDRGFHRLYADNRYAGYAGTQQPAICVITAGQTKAQLVIDPQSVPIVTRLGWDISHARRLVHALDALQDNRRAMHQVYGLSGQELPAANLSKAFAAQLVTRIWNGDKEAPLFTNYWSGDNGWFRVAYDNGTGRCDTGYPPFGLSDSFATGGYAVWSSFYPVIGRLARTIYGLTESQDGAALSYSEKYLPGLAPSASVNTRMLTQLMFWPSLVQ